MRGPSQPAVPHQRWVEVGALVLVAGLVAVGVRRSFIVLEASTAAALLLTAVLWRRGSRRRVRRPSGAAIGSELPSTRSRARWWFTPASRAGRDTDDAVPAPPRLPPGYRWLPFAWLLLTFVSTQKFTARPVEAASSGSASIDNIVELTVYALLAGVLLLRWVPRPAGTRNTLLVCLLLWPAWALLSTAWSVVPLFSFVRGSQLFVPVALAVFTARLLDRTGLSGAALARPYLRLFGDVGCALAVFAFAAPPAATATSGRLTWYGVHPLVAAEIWGAALLAVVVAGRKVLDLSPAGWLIRIGILGVAVARADGRSILAGLFVATAVALWVRGRHSPVQRYLGVIYYVGAWVAALVLFSGQLLNVATRSEGTERLTNLNGRIPLWHVALQQLQTVKQVFVGFGLGAARAILPDKVDFAGHAHNGAIEAMLGTGVIGLCFLVSALALLGWRLRSPERRLLLPRPLTAVNLSIYWFLLVLSVGSPELASVGYSYTLICFLAVFALRQPDLIGSPPDEGLARLPRRTSPVPAPRAAQVRLS